MPLCQQQKRKLRLYISNTFNPARPDADDSDGSIASWELRVEGKLLDDVSFAHFKYAAHSHSRCKSEITLKKHSFCDANPLKITEIIIFPFSMKVYVALGCFWPAVTLCNDALKKTWNRKGSAGSEYKMND